MVFLTGFLFFSFSPFLIFRIISWGKNLVCRHCCRMRASHCQNYVQTTYMHDSNSLHENLILISMETKKRILHLCFIMKSFFSATDFNIPWIRCTVFQLLLKCYSLLNDRRSNPHTHRFVCNFIVCITHGKSKRTIIKSKGHRRTFTWRPNTMIQTSPKLRQSNTMSEQKRDENNIPQNNTIFWWQMHFTRDVSKRILLHWTNRNISRQQNEINLGFLLDKWIVLSNFSLFSLHSLFLSLLLTLALFCFGWHTHKIGMVQRSRCLIENQLFRKHSNIQGICVRFLCDSFDVCSSYDRLFCLYDWWYVFGPTVLPQINN